MRTNQKNPRLWLCLMVLLVLMTLTTFAQATPSQGTQFNPGETMTLEENTSWATLTAHWGVWVRFVDVDGTLLKEDLVPISEGGAGTSSAPADPSKVGFQFDRWVRIGGDDANAILNENGTVSGITGPGPIVYQATYSQLVSSMTIVKVWDDNNNRNNTRPSEITISVSTQFGNVGSYTLNEGNGWSVTIDALPRCSEGGEILQYSVLEQNTPNNYIVSYAASDGKVIITNRYLGRSGYTNINDYEVPLASGYNMNEGDCVD